MLVFTNKYGHRTEVKTAPPKWVADLLGLIPYRPAEAEMVASPNELLLDWLDAHFDEHKGFNHD